MPNRKITGLAFVALSAFGFGSMALSVHLTYNEGIDTRTVLGLRFPIAAGIISISACLTRAAWPRNKALFLCVVMGVFYAAMAWFYFTALSEASSGTVALLLYTYPIFVAITSWTMKFEAFNKKDLAIVSAALMGLALILGGDLQGSPKGIVLSLMAAVSYATYIIIGGRMKDHASALTRASVILTTAAIVYLLACVAAEVRLPRNAESWFGIASLAVFGTAVAIYAFIAGLERLGPIHTSIVSTIEPAVTISLGVLFMGELLTQNMVVGGAILVSSSVVLAMSKMNDALPKSRDPVALTHADKGL